MQRWRSGSKTHSPPLSWSATLLLALFVAGVGVVCALALHHRCVDPGPPVRRPDPGTPRARYCSTMDEPGWRVAVVVLAAAAVLGLAAISHRRRSWTVVGAAVIAVAFVANAIVATSLTFARTI
jgi:hypothetical protein